MNRSLVLTLLIVLSAVAFIAGRISAGFPNRGGPEGVNSVEAVRIALTTGGIVERMEALSRALQSLRDKDWEEVAALTKTHISTLDESDIALVIDAWVRVDLDSALAGVEEWPYPLKREIGFRHVIRSAAAQDPALGHSALDRITARRPRLRGTLHESLVTGWAISDFEGLGDHLARLSPEKMSPLLGPGLGTIAHYHGVDSLLEWSERLIERIPDERQRAKFFRRAARVAARRDPGAAVEWSEAHKLRDHAIDGPTAIAEAWILFSPEDAIEWLRTVAPVERQRRALEIAFGRWLHQDQVAARRWIETELRTRFHDPATAALARQLARRTPSEAIDWCGRVIEPADMATCFMAVARTWQQRDPDAVAAWLPDSPLDEEARQFLRVRSTSGNGDFRQAPRPGRKD